MIVVDASVLLAAHDLGDRHHAAARRLLEEAPALATIDLAVWEVTDVADAVWKDPDAGRRLREAIKIIGQLGTVLATDEPLAASAALIVAEHGLSGYDAAYVTAARRLSAPLASCDVRVLVSRGLAELPSALVG